MLGGEPVVDGDDLGARPPADLRGQVSGERKEIGMSSARWYRSPRKVSVRAAAVTISPRMAASQGLPLRVGLGLALPAELRSTGANLAQEARCPAVGKRVIPRPSSAMSSWAEISATPVISSSCPTAHGRPRSPEPGDGRSP